MISLVDGTLSGEVSAIQTVSGEVSAASSLRGGLSTPEIVYEQYELPPATTSTLGGVIVGDDLLVSPDGRISVDKATSVDQDNTKPITAAAVYTEQQRFPGSQMQETPSETS